MNETMLRVQGGFPLIGNVSLGGSKHTALAIMGVLPLLRGSVKMVNLPEIRDIEHMLKINESLGVTTSRTAKNEYIFSVEEINFSTKELWRVSELRSSILYLGSIMLNTGYVLLPLPGGDRLGLRPLNQFLYILDAFEIPHDLRLNGIKASFNGLEGNRDFDLCSKMFSSTGNNRSALALMLAYANKGTTKMKNVLIVPEIVHLCQFLHLISQGAVVIDGIGTDTLSVTSPGLDAIWQSKCPGSEYIIASDKCEVPFWICTSALTGGNITCHAPKQENISEVIQKMDAGFLQKAGIPLEILAANQFRIDCSLQGYRPKGFDLVSPIYELNGIALDGCPAFSTLLFKAEGKGSFYCSLFGYERVCWATQLSDLGAKLYIKKEMLYVEGCEHLFAKESLILKGGDIRGASSVLLVALATEGKPLFVKGIEYVERGMEDTISKLQSVGASIDVPHTPNH